MNKSEIIKILKKTSEELGDILALPQKNDGKTSEIKRAVSSSRKTRLL